MEENILTVVQGDLKDIQSFSADTTDATLRLESVVLRKSLTDKNPLLVRAWESIGEQGSPLIETKVIKPDLGGIPWNRVVHLQVGKVTASFGQVGEIRSLRPPVPEGLSPSEPRDLTVAEYVDSLIIVTGDARIRRKHLIRYYANKLGGAHWDPTRKRTGDSAFRVLDKVERVLHIGNRQAFPLALLSIAQDLTRSLDVQKIMAAR